MSIGFVISHANHVQDFSWLEFACLGFVVSSFWLSRVFILYMQSSFGPYIKILGSNKDQIFPVIVSPRKISDLVKFVMCILVSMVQMPFYILTKASRVHMTNLTRSKISIVDKLRFFYSISFCSYQVHFSIEKEILYWNHYFDLNQSQISPK